MDQYLGQISTVAFGFAPSGWAFCNGQLLAINQNQALFSLLGTTFGGNGQTTFALPNLQSRIAVGVGSDPGGGTATLLGGTAGSETVTLLATQIPAHSHALSVSSANQGTLGTPLGSTVGAGIAPNFPYHSAASATMNSGSMSSTGGGLPHENRSPFLVVNFIIALSGIFPSRS